MSQTRSLSLIFIIAIIFIIATLAVAPFYLARRGTTLPPDSPTVPVPGTHDMGQHLAVMYQFHNALTSGNIYPRWQPDFNGGYGLPFLNYYPPAVFYLIEAIYLVTRDWILALLVFSALILAASGWAFYLVARLFYSRSACFVAALFYMLAPYHMLDLYWRGALPEYAGFAFIPIIFYFAYKTGEYGHARMFAGLGLLGGLYLMLHLPVAYLTVLALGFYGLIWAFIKKDFRIVFRIVSGLALAILLSSIYLLPAVMESGLVTEPFSSLFQYHKSYVTLIPGADAFGRNINISFVFLVLALVVAFMVLRTGMKSEILSNMPYGKTGVASRKTQKFKRSKSSHSRQAAPKAGFSGQRGEDVSRSVFQTRLFKIMSVAAIFMVTPYSIYISGLIPKINSVCFAWRWLVIACFYIALILTAAIDSLIKRPEWKPIKMWGYRSAIGAIILANIWISINPIMLGSFDHENLNAPQDRREIGFIPKGGARPASLPASPNFSFISGTGKMESITWEPMYRAVTLDVRDQSIVRVKTYFFPGWTARIDGRSVEITRDSLGAQLVSVPAGNHRLELIFVNTAMRNIGTILSMLALILLCGLVAFDRIRHRGSLETQS
jgi:hypothetical protein